MKQVLGVSIFILIAYFWTSCDKPPLYDDTPHITWGSFSKDTVQQMTESVVFKFNFTDGDGDLGKTNDTTNHVIIVDTRRIPNDTLFYQIPTIEQQGIVSGISGELEIIVPNLCCIHPNNPLILCQPINNFYDPIVYKIQIKDNAGRWSNVLETPPLHVKCF